MVNKKSQNEWKGKRIEADTKKVFYFSFLPFIDEMKIVLWAPTLQPLLTRWQSPFVVCLLWKWENRQRKPSRKWFAIQVNVRFHAVVHAAFHAGVVEKRKINAEEGREAKRKLKLFLQVWILSFCLGIYLRAIFPFSALYFSITVLFFFWAFLLFWNNKKKFSLTLLY